LKTARPSAKNGPDSFSLPFGSLESQPSDQANYFMGLGPNIVKISIRTISL
jgi:hypothetical protein